MSDKPAVIQGCYVDCRFMPGLKSARISVDIPIEHANEFLRMFGAPDRAAPVSVVIARLAAGDASSDVSRAPSGAQEYTDIPKPDRNTPSQRAGRLVKDPVFQTWMHDTHKPLYQKHWKSSVSETVDGAFKDLLGIASKTELDSDPKKAEAFERLETSFRFRDQVRS